MLMMLSLPLHASDRMYPPDAVVNVSLPPYEAIPDDGQDDTASIQRAITENVDSGRTLFFPAGTYLISDTLVTKNAEGFWRPHLTFQGQGRHSVTLKLVDHAPGFSDPDKPKAMITTGSYWQEGDVLDGGGNKAFRNNMFDLTIDTGSDNPGAIGVDYAVSNQGSIKHVTIRSGDGNGVAGISMPRKIPGPGLIKNVEVIGFQTGIDIGDIQYGMTLEHITLRDQQTAGIRTVHNVLHIRKLTSNNRVPAVLVTGDGGVLTLLDSSLSGGSTGHVAVRCAGTMLIRNVTTDEYHEDAIRWRDQHVRGPRYDFFSGPPVLSAGRVDNSAVGLLTIEETPEYWNANRDDWEPVGARLVGETDDTAAIQRAIDSGKSTIYLPHSRTYHLSDTVIVRGKMRQFLGMGAELTLGAAKAPFSNRESPRPLIRIDPTESDTVFFDNMFFNAQYPGEVIFENNTPATVVITHSAGWVGSDGSRRSYRNTTNATGRVFIEDVFLPGWEFNHQSVWARQFNPENFDGDGETPQVSNTGGKLWILGFKTEGPAPFISTCDGGVTELLGAYNYISATHEISVPVDSVPYVISNATAALTFTTDNFRDNDYRAYIRETDIKDMTEWRGTNLPPRRGPGGHRSFSIPLFQSLR